MTDLSTKINQITILVNKRVSLQNQIKLLENELQSVKNIISQNCPHCDIVHCRSPGYHRADHWYECNICKQQVGYDVYRMYLQQYNKDDVIVNRKW